VELDLHCPMPLWHAQRQLIMHALIHFGRPSQRPLLSRAVGRPAVVITDSRRAKVVDSTCVANSFVLVLCSSVELVLVVLLNAR
jgi:hypothetical protein